MVTTEADRGCCPSCDSTSDVRRTACTPAVDAWSCAACGMDWAVTVVNPRPDPFLQRLAGEVTARSVLREVDALVKEAPGMSDGALRARLITVLAALDQYARSWPS